MKVGFTGTREGMSQNQKEQLVLKLQELGVTEFHHGDCAGADEQAHEIVREFFPAVKVVVHPPLSSYLRANCTGDSCREPADYLERDRRIVDETDCLIGTPLSDTPTKSGSWYTINYARKKFKSVFHLKR